MIISKCSTRISLAGGSTDLQKFVETYGYGSVISFPCNIYTYITLFQDKYGYNKLNTYLLNYTQREEVEKIEDIHNDIGRVVLKHFNCPPITLNFHSDVFASGSGLASSSSYLISCIKAVSTHLNIKMNTWEMCELALRLEREFNPLTGHQDIYGCAIKGFKQLVFLKDGSVTCTEFRKDFLNQFKMYLRATGIQRNSTDILSSIDIKRSEALLPFVAGMRSAIKNNDKTKFLELMQASWEAKKNTSPLIMENKKLKEMDDKLYKDRSILAHRLCGAGNGGFFLIFRDKNFEEATWKGGPPTFDIPISVAKTPLSCTKN